MNLFYLKFDYFKGKKGDEPNTNFLWNFFSQLKLLTKKGPLTQNQPFEEFLLVGNEAGKKFHTKFQR